jgi:hypothetical protein
VACGETDGTAELHEFAALPHTHSSLSSLGRSDDTVVRAPVRSLDSLVDLCSGGLPTLVKIDTEGSELATLHGARRLLRRPQRPIWSIEVNYETATAFGYRPRDIARFLEEHGGFKLFRVTDRGVRPESDHERAPQGATWLCVPEERFARVPWSWYS